MTKTEEITSSTSSTRWKLPARTSVVTAAAASGNADVAGDAPDLEPRGDAGHLGCGRAQVREDQEAGGREAGLDAVAHADDADQPLAGRDPKPDGEVVEEDERGRRGQQRPKESVAEVGAEDRVGGDPGRVVVGKAGQDPGPDDRQQGEREAHARASRCVPVGHEATVMQGAGSLLSCVSSIRFWTAAPLRAARGSFEQQTGTRAEHDPDATAFARPRQLHSS